MKTESTLTSSRDAALKAAIKKCQTLLTKLSVMQDIPTTYGEFMPSVRANLAELNQRVHEFNAYSNALLTP